MIVVENVVVEKDSIFSPRPLRIYYLFFSEPQKALTMVLDYPCGMVVS
jgi:hypothetical protein